MPITLAGFVRARKHQFGRQASFGTRVAAKRAYPFKGVPTPNLNWTDPDVDLGSIDIVAAPYQTAPELLAPLTDPSLRYNSLPLLMAAIFGGGVTPSGGGTAKTWAWDPASEAPLDDVDVFTYEFGDDVTTDWEQYGDGVLESLEITGPEGLGPVTASMGFRFGSYHGSGFTDLPDSPTVPTSLDVDANEAMVYLKDAGIYISDDPYDIDSNRIADALHSFVLRVTQPWDEKRFANGTQTFDVSALGRGPRVIELEATWAETSDIVGIGSESDKWASNEAVDRYIKIKFVSPVLAQTPSTFYSWDFLMPARYYLRAHGDVNNNAVKILTARAFFDPTNLNGVFETNVTNTLANSDF